MIVRIATEGQYRLSSALLDQVNDMDNALVERIASCNETEFRERFTAMLELIRSQGNIIPPDNLLESHIILPTPDLTLDEARSFFIDDGLFPG